MANPYRKGLQSIICPSCKHYWTEDVDIVGNGVDLPYNQYEQCPECDAPFTADDYLGDVRPLRGTA